MIPIELRLENFLSYADPPPLAFTGFEVACLTGANGVGKSSILDAMTWACFGAARGCEGGQNQDRLIRDGTDATCVEFTFGLGESVYRIKRARQRGGRSELQFMVRSEHGWTNLAGDTLKDTESQIASVLRMDYRTFTASAFLLQGRADDFLTRMKPEDRKEVFARLLDLGAYERLEDAARSHAREAESRRKDHAARADDLRERTRELDVVQAELTSVEEAAAAAEEQLRQAESQEQERQEALAALERTQALADREKESVRRAEARSAADRGALGAKRDELARLDELLARSDEVTEALEEATRLRERDAELRRAAEVREALERRQLERAGQLEAEERTLRSRAEERRTHIAALSKEIEVLVAEERTLRELDEQVGSLGDVDKALDDTRAHLEELRTQDAELRLRLDDAQRRKREILETLDLLRSGGGECPVCAGPLDTEHRRELAETLSQESRALDAQQEQLSASREVVKKDGLRLAEEERRLKRSIVQMQQLHARRASVAARLERLPQLRADLQRLTEDGQRDEALLRTEAFAAEIRADLARVTAELAAHPYDRSEHEVVRQGLVRLREFEQLHGRIQEAAERQAVVTRELEETTQRVAAAEAELADHRSALELLLASLEGADEIRRAFTEARNAVHTSRKSLAEIEGRRARLGERRDGLQRARQELDTAVRSEREAAEESRRYGRLAQAFGRGGIPDRIIDNALPELTAEANDVLGRLTDYEMSLQFTLSRATKTGKVKDTFDVLVHHDGGVREYQMFSGGEAFRIAFAIRMGLSKLLVRRAGARLETLVIDEGFGTQDPEGRERLTEAVNLARREFRKVLVITHLEELKDAFGSQIRVSKPPGCGSTLEVLRA